jgi:tetratricopeptide (TPR) repeat protein
MDESTLALTDTLESDVDDEVEALATGSVVGRYIMLAKLGEGTMGEVFAAYDPELDRKVALKLLAHRHGRHAGARARLRREAQALAKLEHPNVVTVYDVGEHEGQLFIGMEFVAGQTLQDWMTALDRPRPWPEVVRVLVAAGQGLAAAHAVGLVHRDFKPANVMLGSEGRVRVMDFGLVRSGELDSSEVSQSGEGPAPSLERSAAPERVDALTQAGAVLGTPAYMPLEQFEAVGVDARSDQFSFCVTLYEALYGERPFAAEDIGGLIAKLASGRIREPPRGTKVPSWLRKVVLRGLAASPDARWPSMHALLDALADDPARRRRRRLVRGGVGALLLGLAVLAWPQGEPAPVDSTCAGMEVHLDGVWDPSRRAAVSAAMAATQLGFASDTAARVTRGLDVYAAAWLHARTAACAATHRGEQSGELLDLRMACLDERLTHLRATVELLAAADTTIMLEASEMVAGLPSIERCADVDSLRAEQPLPEDPVAAAEVERLDVLRIDVLALDRAGKYADALAQADTLARAAESLGYEPLMVRAWLVQAHASERRGDYERALTILSAAYDLALARRMSGEAAEAARRTMSILGTRLIRFDEARGWARHAGPLARGHGNETLATYLYELSLLDVAEGKYDEARAHGEQALAIRSAMHGEEHPDIAASLTGLGNVALAQGQFDVALGFLERALALKQRILGPDHPDVAASLNALGNASLDQGEPALAERYHRRALAIREQAFGPEHPDVAASLNNLGNVAAELGRLDEAFAFHQRSLAIKEEVLGPDHPHIGTSLNNLGTIAAEQGNFDAALDYHRRALAIREQALGADHPEVATSLHNLGDLHLRRKDIALARSYFERSLAVHEQALGSDHPVLAHSCLGLGRTWQALGDPSRALISLERADRLWAGNDNDVLRAHIRSELAFALWEAPPERGRDRTRALALAQLAHDVLAREGRKYVDTIAMLEQWLAEHRGP